MEGIEKIFFYILDFMKDNKKNFKNFKFRE